MSNRWATFDCYGTLIDRNGGLRARRCGLTRATRGGLPSVRTSMASRTFSIGW